MNWGNPSMWGPPSSPPEPKQEPRLMQLYYCLQCGYWVDKALHESLERMAQEFRDGMVRAFGGTPPEREALPELSCPEGHGELVLVKSDDRIAVIQEAEKP